MINHIKYASSRYLFWLGIFATAIGVIAIVPISEKQALPIVIICFIVPFIIPFIASGVKKDFVIRGTGKSKISFRFGDLFDEECIVITTNRYYDINPTGEHIAPNSLLGKFVKEYCESPDLLECELKKELKRDKNNNIIPAKYGEYIRKEIKGKMVYFLAFTDRKKSDQPKDFYIKAVQGFFKSIVNENHGKTICIPLLGDNNNLSDSGFCNSETTLKNMFAMISYFGIINQRSELKLRIVALPEKRTELINVLSNYCK